jgi:hypothetical protein
MDFKGLTDWVEYFKGGTQTDSKGRTKEFTEADLDQIVANHDPLHPAPHVITHKELYSPFAYGQVSELKREGLTILAKSKNINPTFDKLLQDGALYERSVRLEQTPKGLKLAHIAWLGAEPPAVEGLHPVEYSKDAPECFDYNSQQAGWILPDMLSRFMRGVREWIITKFDVQTADQVVPNYQIDSIAEMAAEMRDQNPMYSKTENDPTGGNAVFTQKDIDDAKAAGIAAGKAEASTEFAAEKSQLETKLQEQNKAAKKAEFQAFVKEQVDAGILLPAQVEGAAEFMQSLDASQQFEFSKGEGDKKQTVKLSGADWFRDFVKKLPKQITLGARPGTESAVANDAKSIETAAKEYQKQQADKGVTVSDIDAVTFVSQNRAK